MLGYDSPMRRLARFAAALVGVVAVAIGLLWICAPASDPEGDGPADPWLWLRRPVVELLHQEKFVRRDRVEALLPTLREGGSVWSCGDGTRSWDSWDGLTEVCREPVYDGPFEHLGFRVTIEQEVKAEVRAVQVLWCGAGRKGSADAERVGPSDAPGFDLWHARIFVPNCAMSWWVVFLGRDGKWGHVLHGHVTREQP